MRRCVSVIVFATRLGQRISIEMIGTWVDESPNPAHVSGATQHFTEAIERRTPIVYRRVREFITDRLPHNCEVLALPLASDGTTIDMLISAFVWDDGA